jgi:hypothetical protein
MANLTKDEVNVLAQRAYDIKAAEIALYNEAIKESDEYKVFLETMKESEILQKTAYREKVQEEHNAIVLASAAHLEKLRQEINDLDKEEIYVSHRWGVPAYEELKNRIIRKKADELFPMKRIRNASQFENKLKSTAVMNKTKTPTEVLEILLTVNEDE